jgi:hypothetical protein
VAHVVELVPFADGRGRRITVTVRRDPCSALRLSYRIEAPATLLPSPGEPVRRDGLWQHTCCEAFVAASEGDGYHELNFSPSRAWAAYRFGGYRERVESLPVFGTPKIDVRPGPDGFELDAVFTLARLDPDLRDAPVRLGLSVVLETTDRELSYWALCHPRTTPDFHDAAGFALRLDVPMQEPR